VPKFSRLIRVSVRVVTGLLALELLGYSIFHAGPCACLETNSSSGMGLRPDHRYGRLLSVHQEWAWRQTFMCDMSAPGRAVLPHSLVSVWSRTPLDKVAWRENCWAKERAYLLWVRQCRCLVQYQPVRLLSVRAFAVPLPRAFAG
jgi:hypothetical protein